MAAARRSGRPMLRSSMRGRAGGIPASPFGRLRTADDLAVEEPSDDHAQETVEGGEDEERYDQPGHRCYRLSCSHDAVNDPGLSSNLSNKPPRLDGKKPHGGCHR